MKGLHYFLVEHWTGTKMRQEGNPWQDIMVFLLADVLPLSAVRKSRRVQANQHCKKITEGCLLLLTNMENLRNPQWMSLSYSVQVRVGQLYIFCRKKISHSEENNNRRLWHQGNSEIRNVSVYVCCISVTRKSMFSVFFLQQRIRHGSHCHPTLTFH
jgi:hypothetical protein